VSIFVKHLISLPFDLTQLSMPSRFQYVLHAPNCYTGARGKRGTAAADNPEGSKEQRDHSSYLLRLWRVGDSERPIWRASLNSVHSGEQVSFTSLEDLFHFLRKETGMLPGADGDEQDPSQRFGR
jgi:hypothetical protein